MRHILILAVASIALGGCGTYGKIKDIAYDKAASTGNKYCETRDPELQTDLKDRVNNGLRGAGAKFEFDGVTCDP